MEAALALAKGQSGAALAAVVMRALRAPGLYTFVELLGAPGVVSLGADAAHAPTLALLRLFVAGSYADWQASAPGTYPPLDGALREKLRVLSLVSAAASRKSLPYAELQAALDVGTAAELEQLVIAAVGSGLLAARMDQRTQVVLVSHCAGRDVQPDGAHLAELGAKLASWLAAINQSMQAIAAQIAEVNAQREAARKAREQLAKQLDERKSSVARELGRGGAGGDLLGMDGGYGGGGMADMLGPWGAPRAAGGSSGGGGHDIYDDMEDHDDVGGGGGVPRRRAPKRRDREGGPGGGMFPARRA